MNPTDDYTNAEIVRSLKRIEDKVDNMAAGYVPRGEFDAYRQANDREMRDMKSTQQRQDEQRHIPWTQVATSVVAIATLVFLLITTLNASGS